MSFKTGFGMGDSGGGLGPNSVNTVHLVNDAVDNTKLADMAAATIKGSIAGGNPADLTPAQVQSLLDAANGFVYQFKKKTASTTAITSATPAVVTVGASGGGNLELAVTAGHYYKVRITAIVQSDAAGTGIGIGLNTPALTRGALLGATMVGADGASGGFQGTWNTATDIVVGASVQSINVDYPFIMEGIIIPSASGNFTVTVSNETGTNNVSVMQGTLLEIWDLGT